MSQFLKQLWDGDYFHALARVKRVTTEEVRKTYIYNQEVKLNLLQRLRWYWVSFLRYRGVPYSYIFNHVHFLGHRFYVDKRVLIPRVETEEFASLVVKYILRWCYLNHPRKICILDIGVGSGVLGLVVIKELVDKVRNLEIELIGVDKSRKAITVAKRNQIRLFPQKLDNLSLQFLVKDIFKSNTISYLKQTAFDFIISNPPYIANNSSDLANEVLKYEPRWALFGGDDGLDFYRHFAEQTEGWLNKKGGTLFIEIGLDQAKKVQELFLKNNLKTKINLKIIKDMFGKERFIRVEYPHH